MFEKDDFSALTGGIGDLNGDGKVDSVEYFNAINIYNEIMGYNKSSDTEDDDDFGEDEEDEDDDDEEYESEDY